MSLLDRVKDAAESHFKLSKRGTTFGTEVRGGTVTFLTMAYILLVNPLVLGQPHTGIARRDVIVGTAVASSVATFICGYFGNLPCGLAPGLGLSAYFSYGVVKGADLSWQATLACCLIAGLIMMFLAITRLSDFILRCIPKTIKLATVSGMGLLLTFISMQTMGLIVKDDESLVKMGPLARPELLMSLFGLLLLSTLIHHGVKGAFLLAILTVTVIVWAYKSTWPDQIASLPYFPSAFPAFNFVPLTTDYIGPILAFLSVGIFDVSGVLFGLSKLTDLVEKDGRIPGSMWAFIAASVGTIIAAVLRCSPIIIHVESAAGIKDGARTGLAAITTSLLFALSLLFAPLFDKIPWEATTPL